MTRCVLRWGGWALVATLAGATLWAQDRPPGPPPAPPGDVRAAVDGLDLSAEQHAKVDPLVADYQRQQRKLRDDLLRQLRATLSPEQYQQVASTIGPRGGGGGEAADEAAPATPATRPTAPLAPGERRVAVTFTGGHDTDDRDHGRPVVLVAAGLGVPADVFRETFTHVRPARGGQEPSADQVRQNKVALMAGLSKYGVTNDRLNEVSNYYRYLRSRDQLWRHRNAVADAVVRDGKVVRFEVTDAGAGYTTPPTATVDGQPDVKVTATLTFGTDLATNGSVKSLAVDHAGG